MQLLNQDWYVKNTRFIIRTIIIEVLTFSLNIKIPHYSNKGYSKIAAALFSLLLVKPTVQLGLHIQ